ncbi:hypothetical protein Ocin01_12869 [Orchesella cincta]|uniref:Uncharacterized protein n=1 Tax=Orchesella cincta TaxID=48709 RepID=A0A1D2MLU1_ORCCI|nr:hypothetical protein Ocin01_12869 [Orchesella cincta]
MTTFPFLCELLPGAVPSLVYTSLTLSTPSSSSNSIKNRIFVPKHPIQSLEATTISPSSSSSSIAPIPSGSNNNEMLSSTSVTSSSSSSSSSNGLDPISITTDDPLSQPSPRIFRRSARNFRSIPHPREIVSRLFEEILVCPNHHTRVDKMLRESDSDLGFATRCNFPGVAFFEQYSEHNYSLPLRVDEVVFSQVPRLQRHLVILANSVVNSLKPIFPTETILEWIEQNMWEAWKALDKLEKAGDTLRNIQVCEKTCSESTKNG